MTVFKYDDVTKNVTESWSLFWYFLKDKKSFNFHDYKSRGSGNLSFSAFLHKLVKVKNLEKGTALFLFFKLNVYERKCHL